MEQWLRDCEHHDQDRRYMALSDVTQSLDKPLPIAQQDTAVRAAHNRLTDNSVEVQAQAVRCLRRLFVCVDESIFSLALNLLLLHNDVQDITLKALLSDCAATRSELLCSLLMPRLVDRFFKADENSAEDACELLSEGIRLCGAAHPELWAKHHGRLTQQLRAMLGGRSPSIAKKAATTLGVLASTLSDNALHELVHKLLEQAQGPACVACVGALSRIWYATWDAGADKC